MKKLLILIGVLIVSNFSCKTKIVKYEDKKLCELINIMNENDQKYRKLCSDNDRFFETLDSIKIAEGIEADYAFFPKEKQLEYGRKARAIAIKKPKKCLETYIDSIMQLQIKLDNKNTELLLDIIKNRGWPNENNCSCKKFPGIIFRHSQEKYWNEIKKYVNLAYEKGEMEKPQYDFIMDHITGRRLSKSKNKNLIFKIK